MSISLASQKLKRFLGDDVSDLDHPELINEKGIYVVFEGLKNERIIFGVYLAYKTLKLGLKGAYGELDELSKKIRDCECGMELTGINLVSYSDRLFVYHLRVEILD